MSPDPSRLLDAVIIGSGPYGLSIAAHFRGSGISYRIFGPAMDSWISHMPKGMLLKSDGFASNVYDPGGEFTLKKYCLEGGIEYADMGTPVKLETFASYGLAFRRRMVPELEETTVVSVELSPEGFALELETRERVMAKRVIFAVGISHFQYIPPNLQHLPPQYLSHSFQHSDLEGFRGRCVAVLGAGASAIDLAGLLYDIGADVRLIARDHDLVFHQKMLLNRPRSLWQQVRSPLSCLGPGLKSRLYADSPGFFRRLPESYRLQTARNFLGPAGGWFSKEKVIGKVPLLLGCVPERAEISDNRVNLSLRSRDEKEQNVWLDHIIAATGYQVNLERLTFLSPELREKIRILDGSPILSAAFESSVPGLYFVGLAAANSFGPVMRFACGARYSARRLADEVKQKGTK
jgi:thioredoxin reductase